MLLKFFMNFENFSEMFHIFGNIESCLFLKRFPCSMFSEILKIACFSSGFVCSFVVYDYFLMRFFAFCAELKKEFENDMKLLTIKNFHSYFEKTHL